MGRTLMSEREVELITIGVYRARLDATFKGDADRMVAKDKDNGEKLERRAMAYKPIVTETLILAGLYERPERGPKRGDKA